MANRHIFAKYHDRKWTTFFVIHYWNTLSSLELPTIIKDFQKCCSAYTFYVLSVTIILYVIKIVFIKINYFLNGSIFLRLIFIYSLLPFNNMYLSLFYRFLIIKIHENCYYFQSLNNKMSLTRNKLRESKSFSSCP